jgi:hypothetical protein
MIDLLAVSHDRDTILYRCPRAGSNWGRSTVLVRRSFFARRSQRWCLSKVANLTHVVLIAVENVLLPHGVAVLQNSNLSRFRLSFRVGVEGDGSARGRLVSNGRSRNSVDSNFERRSSGRVRNDWLSITYLDACLSISASIDFGFQLRVLVKELPRSYN